MRKNRAAGFTLVEMVVVMAIVALLAAIIVPIFSTSGKRINQQTCMNNLHTLGVNLTQYWQDYGSYPAAPLPAYLRTLDPKYTPFGYLPTQATCSALNVAIPADELRAVSEFTGDPSSYLAEVKITALGLDGEPDEVEPDRYEWTEDNWATKHGPFTILDVDTRLPLSRGVSILFKNKNGHTVGDAWTISLQPKLSDDWRQWQEIPPLSIANTPITPETTTLDLNTLGGTATLAKPVGDPALEAEWDEFSKQFINRAVVLHDPDGIEELAVIKRLREDGSFDIYPRHPAAATFTNDSDVELGYCQISYPLNPYNPFSDIDISQSFISGNFGLARFLEIYGLSKRQYHCPQIEATADVETDANLRMSTEGSGFTRNLRFDTLLSGFNTYDVTYNYDQYDNAIRYFDARLGFNELNARRQLKEKFPPADTVVTWCYGHRPDQTPSFDPGAPDGPDVLNGSAVDRQQQNQRNKKVMVLWVDGTVGAMSPYLARGADDAFYWVPPFLYSRGEWQK